MLSARGAVEILVATSDKPLAEIGELLPERASGPMAPRGNAGRPLEPGPIAERIARAELRARTEGAARVSRVKTRASATGSGEFALSLAEGCHHLELMADVPAVSPHAPTDVDAEAHDPTGRTLAKDHGDVPDARLGFCLGEPTLVTVPFAGAAGPVQVTLSDAQWPIPTHIPTQFGARARAGFAASLHHRHAQGPVDDPVLLVIGVQGSTTIPVELVPGRCYVASLAFIRGDARNVHLSVAGLGHVLQDDSNEHVESGGIAFCAITETQATIEAVVYGNSPWWALAVWSMGSTAL